MMPAPAMPTLRMGGAGAACGAAGAGWVCRQNPAGNINFGPEPAEELRSKFLLKLWNTYAFFCNYARLDNFDPNALGGADGVIAIAVQPDHKIIIGGDFTNIAGVARSGLARLNGDVSLDMLFDPELETVVGLSTESRVTGLQFSSALRSSLAVA